MPQRLRIGMAFCAAIATAVVVGACGGGLPGNDVAEVGSAPVTMAAFNHWLVVANDATQAQTGTPAAPLPVPPNFTACINASRTTASTATETTAQLKALCQARYTSLSGEVVKYLVEALWIEGEGRAKHVSISDAQVNKTFTQQRASATPSLASDTALNSFLAKSGQTVADLKWRTYLNLMAIAIQTKVQQQASHVSNAEIAAYYNKHRAQYSTPETLSLHLIETQTLAQANHVKALLETGQTYAALAPKDSIDPTTKNLGGKLTNVQSGTLPAQLSAQTFTAKVGAISGPVKTPFGYYVFTVDTRKAGTQQTLAKARSTVKATVAAIKQQAASATLSNDFNKVWLGRTVCRSDYAIASVCPNAPKTTSTASNPATGSTIFGSG